MPCRWWGVTFAPIPERCCKIIFCGAVVIEHNGVYLQRLPTKGDAKKHTQ